jgi:hypothetical protein
MTITTKQLRAIAESGGDVRTTSGDKIGSIGQLYVDESTGEPMHEVANRRWPATAP